MIIDFGKSVVFSKVKILNSKFVYLTEYYKRSYIVFEFVDGKGKLLVESDIYLFVFLIIFVYEMLKFLEIVVVKKGLFVKVINRSLIFEVKVALCVVC